MTSTTATRDDLAGGATAPRDRCWLVVPILAVVVTTVLFYGAHRIRAPTQPAVVLLAAAGLVAAWGPIRRAA